MGGLALYKVADIRILPRGISDHAPLLLTMELSSAPEITLWRLYRFWVSDEVVDGQFRRALQEYWRVNPGPASALMVWDAFKAYTRGRYQTIIAQVHRERRADLSSAEEKADLQEAQFVRSKYPRVYNTLQSLTGDGRKTNYELTSYLDPTDTPVLTAKYRETLDAPITMDKILKDLKTLQSGKTPGPDGIPVEFYKQYAEELTGTLHAMLIEAQRVEELLNSLSEAVVVVIPKPGKDPSLCSSYRPISLINVDAKLLACFSAFGSNGVHAGEGNRHQH